MTAREQEQGEKEAKARGVSMKPAKFSAYGILLSLLSTHAPMLLCFERVSVRARI